MWNCLKENTWIAGDRRERGQCTEYTKSKSGGDSSFSILTSPAMLAWINSYCRGGSMEPKRSWWQQIKIYRVTILVVTIILIIVIGLIIVGYRFDWTGFNGNTKAGKTLWDWLNLLGVLAFPVVVGFGAVWFTIRQGKVADAENTDNQRETALQAYIDKMSELLLEKKLRESVVGDEVRKIARVCTLTILPRLDADRKRSVLQFLHESSLIEKGKCFVDLSEADLNDTNLSASDLHGVKLAKALLFLANLSEANLSGAALHGAYLMGTTLNDADLSGAFLFHADLSYANLGGANLSGANLKDAHGITIEELEKQAASLKGATMPDGSIHS
jgi:uncharacterized protein YjbI with pentapeptide repeats